MRGLALSMALGSIAWTSVASAQYPPSPQPQPYPQPYGQPQQPYPQPYGPPPQPTFPAQAQPWPQPYGQPQPVPAPWGQPAPVAQPAPPPRSHRRGLGEMAYLYGATLGYGVGTGVWIDSLGKITDPGIAFIPPVAFGMAAPVAMYFWDQYDAFDRGVPSSIATGILLGGIEGVAVSALQWQRTGGENGDSNQWTFSTWTTLTFAGATLGGVGGYAFGEWLQPDPRSLALVASGAGWGTATGFLFGAGVVGGDWKDGSAVWGFAGYNAGVLATGALSTVYVPSYQSLKYMWIGYTAGALATTPVYLFYIGSDSDPRHGLIANSVGALAGLGLAAAFTANLSDGPDAAQWTPPFQLAVTPTKGGGMLSAMGQF